MGARVVRALRLSWLLIVMVLPPSFAPAQSLRPLPPVLRSVSDEAGTLSNEEGRKLADEIEDIRRTTGARIVIVVAETTGSEDIEQYADRLAQRWKRERGVALERSVFIIMAVDDHALHITAGNDLDGVQRAIRAGAVTTGLRPLLREEKYFAALGRITARIRKLIQGADKSSERMHPPIGGVRSLAAANLTLGG